MHELFEATRPVAFGQASVEGDSLSYKVMIEGIDPFACGSKPVSVVDKTYGFVPHI